ncbi:hypothetical protein OLEAN_C12550 [Oleispira antarctica RB-8]|uniref:Protochlamydia outer membrane protein domain-containing protein n=1 Tax=Oleispira antarctica RB-8 TaxID=698738 RepID=R4YL73_OLEAN|nr:hypothetical protein OLEAN_C12550 [Oleispira antarctica RB-8]
MNQIFLAAKATFILLFCGYLSNTHAGSNTLSCALKTDQQYLGALPEFSHNTTPLLGYQCQHIPYYSGFLGNWFPSLPNLYVSQSSRLLAINSDSSEPATNDDSSQTWKVAFSIKRFGQSQLSIFSGQKDWQRVLQAKENITFISSSAKNENDGIRINNRQQAQFTRSETFFGLSLIFPYQSDQKLTELRLQNTIINQPIQADIAQFDKHSLFPAQTTINEIMIVSQSHHRGLNINWKFGLGKGEVQLKPKRLLNINSDFNQIISLRSHIELYYQYRINRRWMSHAGWKGDIHYWQQNTDNDDFKLASANAMEHQVFVGIGLTF